MNIDDRLRSAQKQQLHRVDTEVRRRGLDRPPSPQPRWPWFLTLAMAAAVVALVFQLTPRSTEETVTTAVSPSPDDVTVAPATTSTTSAETTETAAVTSSTTTTTTTGQTVTTTSPVSVDGDIAPGVANQVCGTGFRAPLERAALRYVSEEQGWNRMIDLVNEQDGPFYFGLWEPDYPGTVSVEVSLERPVQATEIRLAQHPYQDVSGTITVETAGMILPIELSGRDGFRSHTFVDPVVIDSFVITRSDPDSNITEVIICVETDQP